MYKLPAFFILGVIASSVPSHSLVVLGNTEPIRTLHIGDSIDELRIVSITRKYVDFKHKDELVRIMVGDGFPQLVPEIEYHDSPLGRLTVMTEQYKNDQLSPFNLGRIFMQCSMQPVNMVNATYYRISSIQAGSIFEMVGLHNDDLIMSINGYPLGEPSQAIRTLIKIKYEDAWAIDVLRGTQQITLQVQIH